MAHEDDVPWIEEPAILVRVDEREYAIHVYDAAQVDPERMERDVREARRYAPHLFMLAYREIPQLDELDLSPLFPEDGAQDGLWSMVDLIDNYMEIHRVVNTHRVGARLELTAYTDRMSEGSGHFTPKEGHGSGGQVACDVEALRAALEGVREEAERTIARAERAKTASADTPTEEWLAWVDDPNPIVRRGVLRNKNVPDDVIVTMTERNEHIWEIGSRGNLPVASVEFVFEHGNHELKRSMIDEPNVPRHVLMRAIEEADGGGRYDERTKLGAKARAILVEKMAEADAGLDALFGELRSLLDSPSCKEAVEAVFSILESASARAPERVAELWVPYARDHMADWDRGDCTLPQKLVLRWKRHREITPSWGIARVLDFQRHVAGTPDSAWDVFAQTPHLGAVESLGVRQQVDAYALECIAKASMPLMNHLVLINWGQAKDTPDASVIADAAWVPQLTNFMIDSYAFPSGALARFLTRAERLEWIALEDLALDATHAEAIVDSGMNTRLRYLSVHEGEVEEMLAALAGTPLPKLEQIHLHKVDVPKRRLGDLAEAFPGIKVTIA